MHLVGFFVWATSKYSFFSLLGSIPFNNLEVLDLTDNIFTGSIPPYIWNLTSLQVLSLANNQLTGSLPVEGKNQMKHWAKALSFFFFFLSFPEIKL